MLMFYKELKSISLLINGTLRIAAAHSPLVNFARVKVKLRKSDGQAESYSDGSSGVASELGPLLF